MNHTGNVGAPLPQPPSQPPPLPPAPPRGGPLVLRVSRRVLWVGTAAVPLHNIAWVDAFRLKPDWGAAFLRFLKWLFGAVLVYVVINYADGGDARLGENGSPAVVVFLIGLFITLTELFSSKKPVLVVEMNSGSRVIVTLPTVDELRQIAGRIVDAIDNPAAEFTAIVQQFNSRHTNNYGPVINMTGGRENTGFKL
ncbi:DUF6232 family protein [Streptomyces sp. NPDC051740]|uniref:DUF6232 family protein n=1 Tax=Streptomyces sp. NPDC051740 TaxID=3365673 RepID=UPI0037A8F203